MRDYISDYMTVPELGRYLSISNKKQLYELVHSGRIPVYQISERKTLVRKSDVDKWVQKHRIY